MKKKLLAMSKVTRGFQVTLSRPVRDKLDVHLGDFIVFFEEDGIIIVEKR